MVQALDSKGKFFEQTPKLAYGITLSVNLAKLSCEINYKNIGFWDVLYLIWSKRDQ